MNVVDNGDGTFTVTPTAEESAAFDQAIASGAVPGGTKAAYLQSYLGTAFSTLQGAMKRQMVDDIAAKLPAQTLAKLAQIKAGL